MGGLLGGAISCNPGIRRTQKIRVGCLPVVKTESRIEIVLADLLHGTLTRHHRDQVYILPLNVSFQSIDLDSIRFPDYLRGYGERIRLDYTLLLEVDSLSGSDWIVRWTLCRPQKPEMTVRDTVSTVRTGWIPGNLYRTLIRETGLEPVTDFRLEMPPPPLRKPLGRARFFLLAGVWAQAEIILKEMLGIRPHHPATGLLNADVWIHKRISGVYTPDEREPKSIRDFLTRLPDSVDSRHMRLAQIYILDEDWNAAEEALHRVLDKSPDDSEALFWLTRLHPARYRSFGFSNRDQILKRVIDLNPASIKARLALAESYFIRHRFDRTRHCYLDLLRIHPRSIDGWMALGKLAIIKKDFTEVIRIHERILTLDPENADAYYNLGIAYYHENRADIAQKMFDRAVILNDHGDAHYYLGVIAESEGRREDAIRHFRTRIRSRSGPDDAFAEEARKRLYLLVNPDSDSFPQGHE
ncbi:MAG TPA: tetratricopeptide repeat protein [bacterium]|nr:tetratricopeptide repeat protein [bacterium]